MTIHALNLHGQTCNAIQLQAVKGQKTIQNVLAISATPSLNGSSDGIHMHAWAQRDGVVNNSVTRFTNAYFNVTWHAGGNGFAEIKFDAYAGGRLNLPGTGINVTAEFDQPDEIGFADKATFGVSFTHGRGGGVTKLTCTRCFNAVAGRTGTGPNSPVRLPIQPWAQSVRFWTLGAGGGCTFETSSSIGANTVRQYGALPDGLAGSPTTERITRGIELYWAVTNPGLVDIPCIVSFDLEV